MKLIINCFRMVGYYFFENFIKFIKMFIIETKTVFVKSNSLGDCFKIKLIKNRGFRYGSNQVYRKRQCSNLS